MGGTVASVFGWLTLVGGCATALLFGLFFQWLMPDGMAGYVVGLPLGLASLAFGLLLLLSGKKLAKTGTDAERNARSQAVYALAANRSGVLHARDVAAALSLPLGDADRFLTEMAKVDPEYVTMELDDMGGVFYRFPAFLPPVRIDPSVGAPAARVETAPQPDYAEVPVDAATFTDRSRSRR